MLNLKLVGTALGAATLVKDEVFNRIKGITNDNLASAIVRLSNEVSELNDRLSKVEAHLRKSQYKG